MATPFSAFYGPLRTLLGDRNVGGLFMYPDETLDSGLRTVFAVGKQPTGYSLLTGGGDAVTTGNLSDADKITPDVSLGDPFALICLWTAKFLISGEDGAFRYTTRSISVADKGDRKRDLLCELEVRIDELLAGECFGTLQSFASWILAGAEEAEYAE
jgi:hypothetical protein